MTDFALYLRKQGEQITLNSVIFAAEALQASKMKLLREVFKTNKICGIYGSSESGVWAYQREEHSGTNQYTCHEDMVHLEIQEDPTCDPGIGNILITVGTKISSER